MTLFRQINSLLFGLFLLVLASLVYFQFVQAKHFMNQQMETDLNNTITSLGLMLQPHVETGDVVSAETLVNVVFEGGFYQRVTLTWLADGKKQIWQNPVTLKGVPDWLVELDLFEEKKQETVITSGWMQLAKLEVAANPAYGYRELWRIMNDTLMVVSLLFLVAIFLLRIRLKDILRPLNEIAEHAKDIAQKKFKGELQTPSTRELKDVVGAINGMAGQLESMFSSLDEELSELKDEKYVDRVSQLPNRQYLFAQLKNWLNEPGYGALVLAKFDWLEDVYRRYGYQGRDELITSLAQRLKKELPQISEGVIARIANLEFAFMLTSADSQKTQDYIRRVTQIVNEEISHAGCMANSGFYLGVAQRKTDSDFSNMLSQADNALQQGIKENKVCVYVGEQQQSKFNRTQWREKLERAITGNLFVFQAQDVTQFNSQRILHQELYCRLTIDGEVVTAAEFMPFVDLTLLGAQLDKCLIQTIVAQNLVDKANQPIAINLTAQSIQSEGFSQWLAQLLASLPQPQKLMFEVSETTAINHLEACSKLASKIKNSGARVGVDNCGRQFGSLDYLQRLAPNYIKLDQSFSVVEEGQASIELCRAVLHVAKGLHIDVVLTGIEEQSQLAPFAGLKIDGYQGFIKPPVNLKQSENLANATT